MSAPYRIEGLGRDGRWTDEVVGDETHEFATLADAQRALDSLVALGHERDELRIVQDSDAPLLKLPTRFLTDRMERALPNPRAVRETRTHDWVRADDPALADVISDARYYADPYGPSTTGTRRCPIKAAARVLLAAIERQGGVL